LGFGAVRFYFAFSDFQLRGTFRGTLKK